jgi:hypothetical protein
VDSGTVFWIIIFLTAGGGAAILATVKHAVTEWRKVREAEAEAALKQDMVQRGMPIEDMVRVLKPERKSLSKGFQASSQEAFKEEAGQVMIERAWEAKDMVKVFAACAAAGDIPASSQTLVLDMLKNEYEADDIVKVIQACQGPAVSAAPVVEPDPLMRTTDLRSA